LNIHESRDDAVPSDVVSTLSLVRPYKLVTKLNLTPRCGQHCRQNEPLQFGRVCQKRMNFVAGMSPEY